MSTPFGNRGEMVSLRRRFFSLPILLSFTVAACVLFFLATGFDLSWDRTWESIRGMDLWPYLIGVFLYYLSFVFRGFRWRMLARNAGVIETPRTTLPSVARFSQVILIGWFVNVAVGFRFGDAYRANILSHASGAGFSWSLGTVLAERVIDMA
ncbi:MAG: lysylphosphatidylglycerol synthase domain-containing protein, partial [Dehalococcoidia bacterium]|nr:lysylphosphatidylglycerol synthase domain-containing protein [Dehalococcoidia bacterium]